VYNLNSGTTYYYALRSTFACGSYLSTRTSTTKSFGDIQLECNPSKADAGQEGLSTALMAPSPSPAVSHSKIQFRIAPEQADSPLRLVIVNVAGRVVRRFDVERATPGTHALDWDLRSESGIRVANGIYYARLSIAGHVMARPVVVQR
jgi:flagellar hook assembly protein FlgD